MCHSTFAHLHRLNHPCILGWIVLYLARAMDVLADSGKKSLALCVTTAALLSLMETFPFLPWVLTFSCCLISYSMSQKLPKVF